MIKKATINLEKSIRSTALKGTGQDLYSPIQRFIDQNHSDYKVSYAEKILRSDRNNSYYVESVSKKKNLEKQQISLYFDGSGRPK